MELQRAVLIGQSRHPEVRYFSNNAAELDKGLLMLRSSAYQKPIVTLAKIDTRMLKTLKQNLLCSKIFCYWVSLNLVGQYFLVMIRIQLIYCVTFCVFLPSGRIISGIMYR